MDIEYIEENKKAYKLFLSKILEGWKDYDNFCYDFIINFLRNFLQDDCYEDLDVIQYLVDRGHLHFRYSAQGQNDDGDAVWVMNLYLSCIDFEFTKSDIIEYLASNEDYQYQSCSHEWDCCGCRCYRAVCLDLFEKEKHENTCSIELTFSRSSFRNF